MRVPITRLRLPSRSLYQSRSHASNFDEFLAANPLPKRSLATSVDIKQNVDGVHDSMRFHWRELSALLSSLDGGHGKQLQWSTPKGSKPGSMLAHWIDADLPIYKIQLPPVLAHYYSNTSTTAISLAADLTKLPLQLGKQAMVLLSADSIALAIWEDDELIKHKVLTGYTIRRSQGKSQLTYMRQGGGARSVGSGIRAREALRLFQAGARQLAEWEEELDEATVLFRGGVDRNWNELYAAKDPAMPVIRDDARWVSVGVGVRRPRLKDLERVREQLSWGTLVTLRQPDQA